MKAPGTLLVPNSAEQVALISSAVVSILVIVVSDYYRSIARRELSDLHELHELSATLASVPELPAQLKLILSTFARIHGAEKGLISAFDGARGMLEVAAQVGFAPGSLHELREVKLGDGACGLACAEKSRVIIEDTQRDARYAAFAALAQREGIRAVHSTPLIPRRSCSRSVVGAPGYSTQAHRREPCTRTSGARKAWVSSNARAEDLVRQRDRRFGGARRIGGLRSCHPGSTGRQDRRFPLCYIKPPPPRSHRVMDIVKRRVLVMPRARDDRGAGLRCAAGPPGTQRSAPVERQSEADGTARYHIVARQGIWRWFQTHPRKPRSDLPEADAVKDEFLATLAHEPRNWRPFARRRDRRSETATESQRRWSQ
jgi:hypothetical protein